MTQDIAALVERLNYFASLGEHEAYQQECLVAYELAIDTLPVITALQAEVERLTQERDEALEAWQDKGQLYTDKLNAAMRREDELREALAVFVQNVDAISLSATLGHITREHLWHARAAYKGEGND